MIHGLIVLNKPLLLSSHAVVEKVRNWFPKQKVGHFGTLDPLAEGVLLVGIGKATKFSDFYMKRKKTYTGKIQFGYATSTYDREGEPITEKKEIDLHSRNIEALLEPFRGELEQTPPIYSAKKFKGKPLYKYARQNKEVEVKPAKVMVHSLMAEVESKDVLRFTAETSSGTYIRSLAHDIGAHAGCGAFLAELRRIRIGDFTIQQAVKPDDVDPGLPSEELLEMVIPIESLLPEFPKVVVNPGGRRGVLNGMAVELKHVVRLFEGQDTSHYRIFDEEGRFLALARKDAVRKQFKPFIVLPT
jgi:tRNA pseudouridine55 synthase